MLHDVRFQPTALYGRPDASQYIQERSSCMMIPQPCTVVPMHSPVHPAALMSCCTVCAAATMAALACKPANSSLALYGFNWSAEHWNRHHVDAEELMVQELVQSHTLHVSATPCKGARHGVSIKRA